MINQEDILYGKISIRGEPVYLNDRYTGAYEIEPKITPQILETNLKVLIGDLNILPIPYVEISNEYGKTVIIGESDIDG